MPRPKSPTPSYLFHISGQARVRLDGQDYYLGVHGSPESYARYYALLTEYAANGFKAPQQPQRMVDEQIRIRDITADFRHRVLPKYKHNVGQYNRFNNLCDLLERLHGDESPENFGPRKLEAIRDQFVKDGCCRRYVNAKTRLIVRIIRHGVSRELVSGQKIVELESLPPLRSGDAFDHAPRSGVDIEVVRKTLPFLKPVVAAMVRLQLSAAMRPSEVFRLTPSQIDRSGETWFYRPVNHKTLAKKKTRAIPITGDGIDALTPYLFCGPDELCFTTVSGQPWDKDDYRRSVERAAKKAKVDHWTPYMLRHSGAQLVRDHAGPEAAQALLGHSRLSTTEIYAQVSEQRAVEGAKVLARMAKLG